MRDQLGVAMDVISSRNPKIVKNTGAINEVVGEKENGKRKMEIGK